MPAQQGQQSQQGQQNDRDDDDRDDSPEIVHGQDAGPDYLSMSDEELAKLPAPSTAGFRLQVDPADPANPADSAQDTDDDDAEDAHDSQGEEGEQQGDQDKQGDQGNQGDQGDQGDQAGQQRDANGRFIKPPASGARTDGGARSVPSQSGKAPDAPETQQGAQDAEGKPGEGKGTEAIAVDYEQAYKQLMAPFRANGREVQVQSVDEAIQLMQMGAGFSKKMAQLRPNLKLMKMLQNNNLLDESKLSFLIDLDKKNPEAIAKYIKDSGIDPMDLDPEKAAAYRQSSHRVSDKELDLDAVLDSIEGSAQYQRTLDVVANRWDEPSKQAIADAPQLIKVIHDHMERGVYDLIANELDRRRTLGQLQGLSDLAAYRQVGDELHHSGGFNHLVAQTRSTGPAGQANGSAATQGGTPSARSVQGSTPNPNGSGAAARPSHGVRAVQDAATAASRAERRRAAGSGRPAVPSGQRPADFNPLALSDEEFSKMVVPGVT